MQRRPAAVPAQRYRGVDRRTPAPAETMLDVARTVAGLAGAVVALVALGHFAPTTALTALGHAGAPAGCLATLAAVAMFIRWRLDGRAQSWWLAAGYGTIGVAALLDTAAKTPQTSFLLSALAVAFFCFLAAWHSPEVDSILSIRLAGLALVTTTAATLLAHQLLERSLSAQRAEAAVVALAFGLLALLWRCSAQDKPWFVTALVGFSMSCAIAAVISNPVSQAAEVTCLHVLINGIVAVTALAGLQAAATRHRALALDAQRERDLVSSLRGELEAKYAETLHEMRSIALALEGGINVLQPAGDGTRGNRLAESLVAELERLRLLADPDHASAPMDFRLAEALQHLVALSRANSWSVTWDVDDHLVVRGRPADVAQILHGLVSNARKYAPDGPIEVSAVHAGEFVLVLVDDRGPGVRPAHRERIFERGTRPEHETEAEGHGLGLHIARRLARSLGGELWVEQHPRGGARFVLALRRAPGHDETAQPGSHRNAS